jgi:hypothetical protein
MEDLNMTDVYKGHQEGHQEETINEKLDRVDDIIAYAKQELAEVVKELEEVHVQREFWDSKHARLWDKKVSLHRSIGTFSEAVAALRK